MKSTSSRLRQRGHIHSFFLSALCLVLTVAVAHAAPASEPARMTDAEIVEDLRLHLDRLVASDEFSGAVLLAKGDQVLFEEAHGFANRAFSARNSLDTKFNLGSMGKMFTAVSILQLAQQGKLSLDDTVLKLVPDYPDKDIASKITVEQLLTHTSGLGDFFNEKFSTSSRGSFRTTESYLPLFVGEPLQFEPGARFSYSNSGFVVLGLIIEHVSGQSYYDYVREHVFKPAGMVNTDNYSVDEDVPNLALGYTRMRPGGPANADGPLRTNIMMHVARGGAPGGGYSTVHDMLRFANALQRYQLLDKKHTVMMLTGKVDTARAAGSKYGYGIGESTVNGVRVIGHGGGFPGISGRLDIYPSLGYVVVVLGNSDEAAEGVSDRLKWVLTGGGMPQTVRLPAQSLQAIGGRYAIAPQPGMPPLPPIEVAADEGGLLVTMRTRRRFLPLSADEFFEEGYPEGRLHVSRDKAGRVIGLTLRSAGSGPAITATRLP